jgi:hypothetical protein
MLISSLYITVFFHFFFSFQFSKAINSIRIEDKRLINFSFGGSTRVSLGVAIEVRVRV